MSNFPSKKSPFPATWGEEGVDVSKDHFITPIGGKSVKKRFHVGADFKFPSSSTDMFNTDKQNMNKYVCMVGSCSGVIQKHPKKPEEEE